MNILNIIIGSAEKKPNQLKLSQKVGKTFYIIILISSLNLNFLVGCQIF